MRCNPPGASRTKRIRHASGRHVGRSLTIASPGSVSTRLTTSKPIVVEAHAKFIDALLEPRETLGPHFVRERDTPLSPNDRGPVVLDHTCGVSLIEPHDRVPHSPLEA